MPSAIEPPVGYEDAHLVGAGATSQVFRARQVATGRAVALKRLRRHLVRDGEALARLRRELEALGRIRHRGIVAVHDLVSWQGDPTLVMELIEGEDLRERIARGRLPFAEVERIARALLDVLALAHGSGIVHRDLKPQNVRLGADGRICLLDFGSARLDAGSQLTRTATTLGTPDYMAPELFVAAVYDPRVDLYGLGATLFECLAGQPPQVADSLAALAHLRATADAPRIGDVLPDVPPMLGRLIDRCLAREPDDRHPSAALALWELDHPAEVGAYAQSRAALPPCLRCGLPLGAQTQRCPGCGSARPFSFGPGRATVLVVDPDPVRLADHATRWFPERTSPDALHDLAVHCAGPERNRLRYVSLVDPADADRAARALRADGLHAEVRLEPRVRLRWIVPGTFLAAFLGLSGRFAEAFVAVGVALFLDRVTAVFGARQCLLAGAPTPRSVAPRLHALAALVAVATLAVFWMAADAEGGWDTFKALLAGACIVLASSAVASLRAAGMPKWACPLPDWSSQLAASFRARTSPTCQARPAARAGYAVMVVCAIAWAGLEGFALAFVSRVDPPDTSIVYLEAAHASPEIEVHRQLRTPVEAAAEAPRPPARPIALQPRTLPPVATVSDMEWLPERPRWWHKTLPALLALPALLLLRGRIVRRAAALYARFDLARLAPRSGRPAPRRCAHVRSAPPMSLAAPCDSFVGAAIKRAAALVPDLPADSARQLERALEALVRGQREAERAEESLLARCILETDPDLEARLGFLALEGRLEAEAALQWARGPQ